MTFYIQNICLVLFVLLQDIRKLHGSICPADLRVELNWYDTRTCIWYSINDYLQTGGRRGRDRMVVGFTYAISAYHHWWCEF